MYDRRIIRGNTYATTVLPAVSLTKKICLENLGIKNMKRNIAYIYKSFLNVYAHSRNFFYVIIGTC